MAEYIEYKTDQQSNLNWGETFKMAVKAPAVADRVFDTYEEADNYVKDPNSSAVAGIIVSVINDETTLENGDSLNGVYYVNTDEHGTVDWCGNPILYLYRQGAVQSDWEEEDPNALSFIRNKPNSDYGVYTIEIE